jgi:hypothetical protein
LQWASGNRQEGKSGLVRLSTAARPYGSIENSTRRKQFSERMECVAAALMMLSMVAFSLLSGMIPDRYQDGFYSKQRSHTKDIPSRRGGMECLHWAHPAMIAVWYDAKMANETQR